MVAKGSPGVPLLIPSLELGWNLFPWRGHCFPSSSAGSGREGRGDGAGITTLLLLLVPWGGSASLLRGFYPFFRLINPKIHPHQPLGNPKFHKTLWFTLRTPASHNTGIFPFSSLEKTLLFLFFLVMEG